MLSDPEASKTDSVRERGEIMKNISSYSEQSLVAAMKQSMISYADFIVEIRRRMAAGETVHPYHADCAEVSK